jgi:hypothetical protein
MAKHVLINKQSAAVSSTQVLANVANPSLLTDGQLAFYNANTNAAIIDTATPGLIPFYIGMGVPSGRNPRITPVIKAGAVKNIEFKSFVAPVQPKFFVGYTGSGVNTINFLAASGTSNVPYGIKLENMVTTTPPYPKAYSQFTLRSSIGTVNNNPVYVADQLAKDLNQQLTVFPQIDGGTFATVDVLSDITLATAPHSAGTTPTYAVTNGSPVLTITAGAADLALNAGTAAGCWVRVGGSAATNPIYQIASVTNDSTVATITLTRPFVGTTATGVAIANLKVGASASVLPTSSSLSGLYVQVIGSYFTTNAYAAGKLNNYINIPLMDTLAGTPITTGTQMVYGSGTVSEVVKKEMQALGDLGVENRIWMPLPNDTYAASNLGTGASSPVNGYTIITLNYENPVSDKSAQGQGRVEAGSVDICINNYQSGTTAQTMTNLVAMLASLTGLPSGTVSGSFPSVTYPNW